MRIAVVFAVLLLAAGVRMMPAGNAPPVVRATARSKRRPAPPASPLPDDWSWAEFVGDSAITLGFLVLLIISILTKSLPTVWRHSRAPRRRRSAARRRPI